MSSVLVQLVAPQMQRGAPEGIAARGSSHVQTQTLDWTQINQIILWQEIIETQSATD